VLNSARFPCDKHHQGQSKHIRIFATAWSQICSPNQDWAQEARSHLPDSSKTSTKTQ